MLARCLTKHWPRIYNECQYQKRGLSMLSGEQCVYCGEQARDLDHVIPQAVTGTIFSSIIDITVPACQECNLIAGYHLHSSLNQRRTFIKARLKKKYKRDLNFPDWTHEELEELGCAMRLNVEQAIRRKKRIQARLAFVPHVDKLSSAAAIGRDSVMRNVATRITRRIARL